MTKRQILSNFKKYITSPDDVQKRLEDIIELSNSLGGPKIKKDKIRGWGLFADRNYQKGEIITKYGGAKVSKDAVGDYIAVSGKGSYLKCINGLYGFNIYSERGRWINEYDGQRSKVNVILGERVLATKDIKKGEQFFADYGDEYERTY